MCVSMASGLAGLHWKLWHTAKLTRSNVFSVKNYSRIKVYVTWGDPSWLSNHPNTGLHFKLSVNSTQNGCIYTYIWNIFSLSLLVNHQRGGHHRLGYAPPFGSAALRVYIPSLAGSQSQPSSASALVADWTARMTARSGLGERNSTAYPNTHV